MIKVSHLSFLSLTKLRRIARLPSGLREQAAKAMRRTGQFLLVPALLGVLIAVFFGNACQTTYVLDAHGIIEQDPYLQTFTLENLYLIFTHDYWWPALQSDLYRPLTKFSYLLIRAACGPGGAGIAVQHGFNLLLHWVNALLVYRLLRQILASPLTATFATALFTIHPLNTEAVTNLVGRADLLSATFVLTGLALHAKLCAGPTQRTSLLRTALGATAILAVISKESGLVLLPLMLLQEFLPPPAVPINSAPPHVQRGGVWNYFTVVPAVLIVLLARHAFRSFGDLTFQIGGDNPLVVVDFWTARLTALKVLGHSLGLFVWPSTLSCDYSHHQIPLFAWAFARNGDFVVWAMLLLLAAVGPAIWLTYRKLRPFWCCAAIFAVAYLPTSNLTVLIGVTMGERLLYLSIIGLAGAAAFVLSAILHRAFALLRISLSARTRTVITFSLASALILAAGMRTRLRNEDWRNDISIWAAAMRVCPHSFKIYEGLATALHAESAKHLDESIRLCEHAMAIIHDHPLPLAHLPITIYVNLGHYYMEKGDQTSKSAIAASVVAPAACYLKAVSVLMEATRIDQEKARQVHAMRRARGVPERNLVMEGRPAVYEALGLTYKRLGRYAEALEAFHYQQLVDPGSATAYFNAAACQSGLMKPAEAVINVLRALVLQPDDAETWQALTQLYAAIISPPPVVRLANGRYSLNTANEHVRADLNAACRGLAEVMMQGQRWEMAEQMRNIAITRFGCSPSLFGSFSNPQ